LKIDSPHKNKKFSTIFDKFKTLNFLLKNKKKINIIDVGANRGQSVKEFERYLDYKKLNIECFEPNSNVRNELIQTKEKYSLLKKNFQIRIQDKAISNKNDKTISFFNNLKKSQISSIYKINKKTKNFIVSKKKNYHNHEEKKFVKTITLSKYIKQKKINLVDILKIDTQGHEVECLDGAKEVLNKINIIVVSILFFDFYIKKRVSFFDIEKIIKNKFIFWDLVHLYKNPKSNAIDHVEAVYINKNLYKKLF